MAENLAYFARLLGGPARAAVLVIGGSSVAEVHFERQRPQLLDPAVDPEIGERGE